MGQVDDPLGQAAIRSNGTIAAILCSETGSECRNLLQYLSYMQVSSDWMSKHRQNQVMKLTDATAVDSVTKGRGGK